PQPDHRGDPRRAPECARSGAHALRRPRLPRLQLLPRAPPRAGRDRRDRGGERVPRPRRLPRRDLDYLARSIAMIREWVEATGRSSSAPETMLMIDMHHKLSRYRGEHEAVVEAFRRSDLIDVALGAIHFGLPAEFVRDVRTRFPNAGFHATLA